jgi:hypothetical protein
MGGGNVAACGPRARCHGGHVPRRTRGREVPSTSNILIIEFTFKSVVSPRYSHKANNSQAQPLRTPLKPDNATKESKRKRRKAKGLIEYEDGLLPQDFTAMTRCPARVITSRLLLATILTRRQRTPNLGRLGTASATTARRRMMSPRGRIKRRFSLEAVGRHSSLGIHGSC